MLFFPKNYIYKKIFYDEPTSVLFLTLNNSEEIYYRVDRELFLSVICPLIRKESDIRQIIIWGTRNRMVQKIERDSPDIELVKFNGK